MRIIQEGKIPDNIEQELSCKRCNTIFTVTNSDIQSDFRDGDYVICPTCHAFINTSRILINSVK